MGKLTSLGNRTFARVRDFESTGGFPGIESCASSYSGMPPDHRQIETLPEEPRGRVPGRQNVADGGSAGPGESSPSLWSSPAISSWSPAVSPWL